MARLNAGDLPDGARGFFATDEVTSASALMWLRNFAGRRALQASAKWAMTALFDHFVGDVRNHRRSAYAALDPKSNPLRFGHRPENEVSR
jgi:hypothetical protein